MTIEFPVIVPRLPQELYDVVMAELAADADLPESWRALCQCALVNYSFYLRSSSHLFSDITLIRAQEGRSPNKNTIRRLERLNDILKANPWIARRIQSCGIETWFNTISRAPERDAVFGHNLIASILNQLPALTHFSWINHRGMLPWSFVRENSGLVTALHSLRARDTLRSITWECIYGLPPSLFTTASRFAHVSLVHVQPSTSAKDLIVDWQPEDNTFSPSILNICYGSSMLMSIAHGDFYMSGIFSRLQELHLWMRCAAEAESAASIMHAAAETLQVVVIKDLPYYSHIADPIELISLPALRELTLSCELRNHAPLPSSIAALLQTRLENSTVSPLQKLNISVHYMSCAAMPKCDGREWWDLDETLASPALDNLEEINIEFRLSASPAMKMQNSKEPWPAAAGRSLSKTFGKFKSRIHLHASSLC
ncbi:hypothetical protein D9619_012760 [Psilocybe cf. subviscida]|uniref:Uncharacterized protein n=1 Tax=Psilocybe cf. subviscida TaxID=2480587 RepID=A0A8H5ARZ8_9AGAR|nr:hypothetical protein D9619_012760 [Psilocybe cf. subviscida]